jgi:hypothetical protein
MPLHWTYADFKAEDDLFQGDILARTPEIQTILASYHSYFLNPKFTFFVVTSQTCDLVVRGDDCKASYINLAVVRELDNVLPALIAKRAGTPIEGVFDASRRPAVEGLISRIINQNEQSLGMFYLHPEPPIGVGTPSVALLRVSIAVRSVHYHVLRSARRGRLSTEFQGKLGWLCGNLYSRVATTDWRECSGRAAEEKIVLELLQSVAGEDMRYFVHPRWIEEAKRKEIKFDDVEKDEALKLLKQHAPEEPIVTALSRVRSIALKLLADNESEAIKATLHHDDDFKNEALQWLIGRLQEALGHDDLSPIAEDAELFDEIVKQAWVPVKRYLATKRAEPIDALKAMLTAVQIGPIQTRLSTIIKQLVGDEWTPEMQAILKTFKNEPLYDVANIDRIIALVEPACESRAATAIDNLCARLGNDGDFKKAFKQAPFGTSLGED